MHPLEQIFRKIHKKSGGSGSFAINNGTQKILNRNSVVFGQNRKNKKSLLYRVLVGLPAYGRRIAGDQAVTMFFDELPKIIKKSSLWKNLDHDYFLDFIELIQKQEKIRQKLRDRGNWYGYKRRGYHYHRRRLSR
jgi:predicted ABC-class ATPase